MLRWKIQSGFAHNVGIGGRHKVGCRVSWFPIMCIPHEIFKRGRFLISREVHLEGPCPAHMRRTRRDVRGSGSTMWLIG